MAVAVLSLALVSCDRSRQADPPPPIRPVLSLIVQPTAAEALNTFSGTVEPRYETDMGFRVAGRMVSRSLNVGDRVTKGQELARLDPTVERLAVASAEADLANARAQFTNALATFQRQQELLKTASAAQAQVDAAVAARDTAQARVGQAEASLEKAREQLGYTTLASDYDGVIASWSAEVGQVVSAGQTVVRIARPDERDAVFDVPDALVSRFPPGAAFTVTLLADPRLSVQGAVREVSPQADAATRTRRIRMTLDRPGDAFRLGTTVRTVLAEAAAPRLEVPVTAIVDRDGRSAVWLVVPAGTVQLRPVTLGTRDDVRAVVTAGLAAGDRVVIAGVHSLSDGEPVKLSEP